ncbi:hypothetical protein CWS35_06855 [Bradyrhizobium sp. SK17]|nr:hypothetical protein CWS35_06855 [Bradyrhizobium sp. SK17]
MNGRCARIDAVRYGDGMINSSVRQMQSRHCGCIRTARLGQLRTDASGSESVASAVAGPIA